jgi:hypothetical protein
MGKRTDHFSSAGHGRIVNSGQTMAQAQTWQPEDFVDREELEKLFLGVDFLNYLALKLLGVAVLCLLSMETM